MAPKPRAPSPYATPARCASERAEVQQGPSTTKKCWPGPVPAITRVALSLVAWSIMGLQRHHWCRNDAMPNAAIVELNRQAVRREKRALAPILGPQMAGIIHPGARREAGLVDQIHVPALHGDERVAGSQAVLHAAIL